MLILLLFSCDHACRAEDAEGGTLEQWREYNSKRITDRSLICYYAFDEIHHPNDIVKNSATGQSNALAFQVIANANEAATEFRVCQGRWMGKTAARLDRGCYAAPLPATAGKTFTTIMWFRRNGQGSCRGNAGARNGTLIAAGDGYWSGWRLTIDDATHRISFEIGRPAPANSIGIQTGSVDDNVWHHLAATWDGQQMRVYVDGSLTAQGRYEGKFTPPPKDAMLRIGYADSGIGSAHLDVDEVAIFDRALSEADILRDLYFYAGLSSDMAQRWIAARSPAGQNDPHAAGEALAVFAKANELHRDVATAVRLQQIDLNLQSNELLPAQAGPELGIVSEASGLPSHLRRRAAKTLTRMLMNGDILPKALYERALKASPLTEPDRLTLQFALGRSLAASGDLAAAREQYRALASAATTPPALKSLALMALGRACVLIKDFPAARTAYGMAKDISDAPAYRAIEVAERLREIDRMERNEPPRDGLAGRTPLLLDPAPGKTLFVAPGGLDSNPGTEQKPFATLARARDEIRQVRNAGGLPAGGIAVLIHGGRYEVRDTLQLEASDSGTADAPIIYRAFKDESPCFDAGQSLSGSSPVTDPAILNRLPFTARGKVVQIDLKASGIGSIGAFTPGGFASARGFTTHPMLELFVDGQRMPLARWPNNGFAYIASVDAEKHNVFGYDGDEPAQAVAPLSPEAAAAIAKVIARQAAVDVSWPDKSRQRTKGRAP